MPFVYNGWTLYRREVIRKNGNRETVYFFSTRTPREGENCDLPIGYSVKVMNRTGLPILVKDNNL